MGACYCWHGAGGFVFNSSSPPLPHTAPSAPRAWAVGLQLTPSPASSACVPKVTRRATRLPQGRRRIGFPLRCDCPPDRSQKAPFERTHTMPPSDRSRSGLFPSAIGIRRPIDLPSAASDICDKNLGMCGAHHLRRLFVPISRTALEHANRPLRLAGIGLALQHLAACTRNCPL